jgi:hypothetical protein
MLNLRLVTAFLFLSSCRRPYCQNVKHDPVRLCRHHEETNNMGLVLEGRRMSQTV